MSSTNAERHKRIDEAKHIWHSGDQAFQKREYKVALRCYRAAHDLVIDIPGMHRAAHERLVEVHRELGMWSAWARDNALLVSAPLGGFQVLGFLARAGRVFSRPQTR